MNNLTNVRNKGEYMNREDIIKLAREAGLDPDLWNYTDAFERFANLVAEHEREACASICFQEGPSIDGELIAEAIRARGNT